MYVNIFFFYPCDIYSYYYVTSSLIITKLNLRLANIDKFFCIDIFFLFITLYILSLFIVKYKITVHSNVC